MLEEWKITVYDIGTLAPPMSCGYTVRSESRTKGYIISPTYPGMYPDNLFCYYKFHGKPGQRLKLTFVDFSLFHGDEYCPFDYLKIYDGYTSDSPEIGTFCGKYNKTTLYSTSEALHLEFVTSQGRLEFGKAPLEAEADFSFDRRGFNITYEFSDKFVNLAMDRLEIFFVQFVVVVSLIQVGYGILFVPSGPIQIPENVPNGTLITTLTLENDESNLKASDSTKKSFRLVPHGTTPNSWDVFLNTALDRDYGASLLYLVFGYDRNGQPKTKQITLIISDVNDVAPQFLHQPYTGSIFENAVLNTDLNVDIEVEDPDNGNGGVVDFQFIDQTCQKFTLTPIISGKGVKLKLNGHLDFEQTRFYECILQARDRGIPSLNSTTSVYITVNDMQDEPPVFIGIPYNWNINEQSNQGQVVGNNVKAVDGDRGVPNLINYTITDDCGGLFDIGDRSGIVSLSTVPDRDTGLILNNNGVCRGQIKADNSIFNLSLLTMGEYFEVDPVTVNSKATVFIRVKNNTILDYEKHKFIIIQVKAQESKTPQSRSSTAEVNVTIEDVNDNSPIFTTSRTDFDIAENSHIDAHIADVMASDKDSGIFGKVTYSLIGGDNKFAIDIDNGSLTVNGDLDRELRSQYFITIEAKDGGDRRSSKSLTVNIHDMNDNHPVFQKDIYQGFIKENSNFTRVVQVMATDIDEMGTDNSNISYKIIRSSQSNKFAITSTGQLVLTDYIDFEALSTGVVNITVVAEDHGSPQLQSNSTTIIITVTDENDNPPVFDASSYNKSILENLPIGSNVLSVSASDGDGSEPNNKISFIIFSGSSDKFRINSQTGEISTAGSLDREDTSHYSLLVIANDNGSPSQSDNVTVNITITDVNDSPPVFIRNEQTIDIAENSTGMLTGLSATDKDENSQLEFDIDYSQSQGIGANQQSLNSSVIQNLLSIESTNGSIILNSVLDREKYRQIQLVITVKDLNAAENTQTATGSLIINVEDVDDHLPSFNSNNYTASITENAEQDIPITFISPNVINAVDIDQGDNAKFEIDIRGDSGTFSVIPKVVTSLGSIVIKVVNKIMLDYEKRQNMSFEITAKPVTRPTELVIADIFVYIDNVNEFTPQIIIHESKPEIYENATKNTLVTQVDVYDNDTGNYGQLSLSLSGESELFDIYENGSIYLNSAKLDREKKAKYYLTIEALDKGGKRSTENLEVHIKDINDERPIFVKTEYTAVLVEDADRFTRPLFVQATDNDEVNTTNSQIIYSINAMGTYSDNFTIGNHSGVIGIQSPIDFERLQSTDNGTIHLNIIASDLGSPQLTTSIDVLISIEDINDHRPSFTHQIYNTSILENAGSGSMVTIQPDVKAVDQDGSSPNKDVFYIIKRGASDRFSINSTYGQIMVVGHLDREETGSYELIIEAVDRGTPSKTGTATVSITIDDVNNKAPQFFPAMDTISVNETNDIQTPIYKIKANDSDLNPELEYDMTWNNCYGFNELQERINSTYLQSVLHLNSTTGEIKLKTNLDREIIQQISLQFTVTDKNGTSGPQISTGSLVINIVDINDNKPTFSDISIEASVGENMPVGIPLTFSNGEELTVSDKDKDDNSVFELKVEDQNDIFEVVPTNVRSTSTVLIKIKNNTLLDYEKHHNFTVKVIATEQRTKEKYENTITIQVNVLDSNDNDPIFNDASYIGNVSENSNIDQFILDVQATDKDSGLYGNITYMLQGGENKFKLIQNNSQASVVVKSKSLDREIKDVYYLTVLAVDESGTGRRQTVPLEIHILDENDNQPIFRRPFYEGILREGESEFERSVIVEADDDDIGANREVAYHIINNSTVSYNFTINSTSGILSCASPIDFELLDHTNQGKIKLYVLAKDNGRPQQTSDAELILITVNDLNDETPSFDQLNYSASIPENSTEGAKVVNVHASDKDGSSPNNEVFYLIGTGGSDNFRINSSTGEITVGPGAHLDRDVIPNSTFWLTVLAVDRGTDPAPLSSSTTVEIFLTDINNKPPQFQPEIVSRNISEDLLPATTVYDFLAKDPDTNSDLFYQILWSESKAYDEKDNSVDISQIQNWFLVENTTGTIKVNSTLDREIAERIILQVFTKDKNSEVDSPKQTATGTLSIDIQDVNDNKPEITNGRSIILNISESTSVSTELTTLSAIDKDKNQDVTFALNGTGTKYFDISPTGKLTLSTVLDRETQDLHQFEVIATDNGHPSLSSIVPVTVHVLDFNDNSPVFNMSVTQFKVPENADNLTHVANAITYDMDIGPNANVTYRLLREDSDSFRINPKTGEIFVDKPLDREQKDKYIFNIEAHDNPDSVSEKTNKASQTITVIIEDVNDNVPLFAHPKYTAVIPETLKKNSIISSISPALIKAVDDDIGNNSRVVYKMADNQTDLFNVTNDGDQAKVVVLKSLRGLAGTYNMTVVGEDKGNPSKQSTTVLSIEIKDENINPPVFKKSGPINPIDECVKPGRDIYTFMATDADKDKETNGKVKYRFDNDSALSTDYQYFRLDEDNGHMTLVKQLDYEVVKVLKIRIIAYDLGLPDEKSAVTPTLTIYVNDDNDNPPTFNTSSVLDRTFIFKENMADPDITVGHVEATDPDDNSTIYYSIVASKWKDHFRINSSSGDISVIKSVDRESSENPIELEIQAEDRSVIRCQSNQKNFTSNTTVFFNIQDVNDNPPMFKKKTLTLGFRSTSQYGSEIVNLKGYVTDPDTDKYSIHKYTQVGDLNIDTNVETFQSEPILLTPNGTVFTNIKFETSTVGLISLKVKVSDAAGEDNLDLKLYVIGDKQVIKMTLLAQPEEVRVFQEDLVSFISNVTGITFVPDELLSHVDDAGNIIKSRSDLFLHGVSKDGVILDASDLRSALDTYSTDLQSIHSKFKVIEVYKALKEKLNNEDDELKKKEYILIAVIVCLVAILLITVFMFLRNFSSFKRKLKAAAIDVKSSGKKKVADISPMLQQKSFGRNNPLFQREEICPSNFDNVSDRLDDNEVNGDTGNEEVEEEITLDLYDEIDSTRKFNHQPAVLLKEALRHHKKSLNAKSMSPEIIANPVYNLQNDINLDELETTEI